MGIENEIERLTERHDTEEEVLISDAYPDGGSDRLFPPLAHAVINQTSGGAAMFSRYAIWANTVRDNLRAALEESEAGNHAEARRLIHRSVNSLSAFSEIQALLAPMESRKPQGSRRHV